MQVAMWNVMQAAYPSCVMWCTGNKS